MMKALNVAMATLMVAALALAAVPAAGAQPGDLAPPCLGELDVEFNPNPCGVVPTPTPPTPVNPDGPGDLAACTGPLGINPCPDDDPEPPPPLGPGDLVACTGPLGINPCPHEDPDPVDPTGDIDDFAICEIDPLTLINPCDDGGETPDDGETPDGDEPEDDGETPDDGDDGIDPADPADPIDGDPNFTG